MGSKVGMLSGSLGSQLLEFAPHAQRFIDLFAGSGAVARHVATTTDLPVVAVDLMTFSSVVTGATIERVRPLDAERLFTAWDKRAHEILQSQAALSTAAERWSTPMAASDVIKARQLCATALPESFIWSHYGGYYFSPAQALTLSAFHAALPRRAPHRTVALAALLRTASKASASPGHTAQPFRPTERLLPHLRSAWRVDVRSDLLRQVNLLAPSPARVTGQTVRGDSVTFARRRLADGDLVFCDPPYSEAQYSRFYHVLEGIARGGWSAVFGAGRAPSGTDRPSSDFSRKSTAVSATSRLIDALAAKRCTVLWTYPEGDRSNGLTVGHIREKAKEHFVVSETLIPMRHSTLGGSKENHDSRHGRRDLHEVLFLMKPKSRG
jgi:adenine-specific DNA methylase